MSDVLDTGTDVTIMHEQRTDVEIALTPTNGVRVTLLDSETNSVLRGFDRELTVTKAGGCNFHCDQVTVRAGLEDEIDLSGIQPGRYTLSGTARDYVPSNHLGQSIFGNQIRMEFDVVEASISEFEIPLRKEVFLTVYAKSGSTRTSRGRVRLFNSDGHQLSNFIGSARVPSGQYYVSVEDDRTLTTLFPDTTCAMPCDPTTTNAQLVSLLPTDREIEINVELPNAVSGSVTSGGIPVQSATVELKSTDRSSSRVDYSTEVVDGTYGFSSVLPGSYYLLAHGDQYATRFYPGYDCGADCDPYLHIPEDVIEITANSSTTANFELNQLISIHGTVRSRYRGYPLADVQVTLFGPETGEWETSAITGADGSFSINGFPRGSYSVRMSGYRVAGEFHTGCFVAFGCSYGATPAVQLEDHANLELLGTQPVPLYIQYDGPEASAPVIAGPGETTLSVLRQPIALEDSDLFIWLAPPNRYYLLGRGSNDNVYTQYPNRPCPLFDCDLMRGESIDNFETTNVEPIVFGPLRGGHVSGVLRLSDPTGSADTGFHWVSLSVRRLGDQRPFSRHGEWVYWRGDALELDFSFDELPEGEYVLQVGSTEYWNSIRDQVYGSPSACSGENCLGHDGFVIAISGVEDDHHIEFATTIGHSISGILRDSQSMMGVQGAVVHLFDEERNEVGADLSDENGFFRIGGLASDSSYQLMVSTGEPGIYVSRIGKARGYQNQVFGGSECFGYACRSHTGTIITTGSSRTDLQIDLDRALTIGGTVFQVENSAAIPELNIDVFNEDGQLVSTTQTNRSGRFTTTGLPPGRYELRVVRAGLLVGSVRETTLTASSVEGMDLEAWLLDERVFRSSFENIETRM